jgi:oligopeptide/dipeptide ABC transporter ATP-binding protein
VVAHRVPGPLHRADRAGDPALRRLAPRAPRPPAEKPLKPILEVSDLQTHFSSFGGTRVVKAVDHVSFALREGETLGLVGESGSGKTTTCLSIVGLLPRGARIVGGSVLFEGEELTVKSQRELRRIRGRRIAMILQDPMASLNPLFTIFRQVAEPAFFHQRLRGRSLRARVQHLLHAVRIPSPEWRMRDYPHQMSGGMRQRIVGAIALAGGPKLVIADEPTTNLDVTVQAQYLDLLKDIQRETGVALIFVTHNLGIVAKMCDRVAVMYAGRIVEQAPVRELFDRPKHPYTRALLGAMPKLGSKDPLYAIPGQPPNLASLPRGCAFHPRCPEAVARCLADEPGEFHSSDGSVARCWLLEDVVGRS